MNEQELKELALQLHKAQIQEYPWVSADPEDAESYIRTYGDTNVHLYYDYLLANGIGEVEDTVEDLMEDLCTHQETIEDLGKH